MKPTKIVLAILLIGILIGFLIYLVFDPMVSTQPVPPLEGRFVDELGVGKFKYPTDLAITQDGTMFVAERRGAVWIVRNGVRVRQPFLTLNDVETVGESGLLGLAVGIGY